MEKTKRALVQCVGFISFLIMAQASGAAQADQPASIPSIEQVVSAYGPMSETQQIALSADGTRVAFRKLTAERDMVIVYSLTENKMLTGLNVEDINPNGLRFLDANHLILWAFDHGRISNRYRGSHDLSTAFVFNVDSGNLERLLRPGDVIAESSTRLGRIVGASSDNKFVYMPAYVPERKSDLSPDLSLLRVDLDSPRNPRQIVKGSYDTRDYFIDGKGNVLAQTVYDNETDLFEVKVPRDGDWKTVYSRETDTLDGVDFRGVTSDLKSLVLLKTDQNTGRVAYYTLSLEDGSISEKLIGRDDADVGGLVTNFNRIVEGVWYSGFTPKYQLFDPEQQARLDKITAQFPGRYVVLYDRTPDWQHLIVWVSGDDSSGAYYLASEGEQLRYLTASRPVVTADMIQPVVEHSFEARDGLTIPTLLTLPLAHADNPQSLPTIILPHGGPASHDQKSFDWMAQAFAARGYLVVQPQFRGSTGFGAKLYQAGWGEWGRKMQDDLTDAVEYFAKGGVADPKRVCIVGSSYGGYAALAGAAFTPDLYRCAVSINGVSDVEGLIDDRRSSGGDDSWVVSYFERSMFAGDYTDENLKAISPLQAVDKIKAPILLIHGEDDTVVPIAQSKDMEDALEDKDKPVTFIELDEDSHYLHSNKTRQQTLKAILEFVDPYLSDS
ncbi:alpha/beta hydrolase family protein [Gilvimarinus xylanilyticus]|uniref:Prolyl oligopeptidase family serine peptidase n=1 Tax=Gilvimarinus xylanilyticus TaxID=2944139 RepID=A0A9X2KRN0_9GAMM|nr:alpha/beta fold hydrolase [Gilvimarinus xylanilyticus]MCP8898031.1 prolyl oligopeptidase family serine peptidase [Gilvimarinus xylanilyticus]